MHTCRAACEAQHKEKGYAPYTSSAEFTQLLCGRPLLLLKKSTASLQRVSIFQHSRRDGKGATFCAPQRRNREAGRNDEKERMMHRGSATPHVNKHNTSAAVEITAYLLMCACFQRNTAGEYYPVFLSLHKYTRARVRGTETEKHDLKNHRPSREGIRQAS